MMENSSIFFVPLISFIVSTAYMAWWAVGMVYLYSAGQVSHQKHALPFAHYEMTSTQKQYAYVRVFELFWKLSLMEAINQFIIIGTVMYWYFRQRGTENNVLKSVYILFRYHLGTVALGSFLIALCNVIKEIIT